MFLVEEWFAPIQCHFTVSPTATVVVFPEPVSRSTNCEPPCPTLTVWVTPPARTGGAGFVAGFVAGLGEAPAARTGAAETAAIRASGTTKVTVRRTCMSGTLPGRRHVVYERAPGSDCAISDPAGPAPAGYFGLNASNGFRQARQKCVVRHSVGPNALSTTVSMLPQNGHAAAPSERRSEASGTKVRPSTAGGGGVSP